ncbi:MAG: HD domain-containing protein [Candidatus Omnitrophica bacterium]|nr:HD domain-containing protein [Candidatus Omnitrophota bacterium]
MIFKNFRFKVTVLFVLLMFLSGFIGNFFVYEYSLRSQMDQLRNKLMVIAQLVAKSVDAKELLEIPLDSSGVNTPQYKRIEGELNKIRDIVPSIVFIYIMERTQKECVFKFIIDLHPGSSKIEPSPAKPGEEYDCTLYPEMMKAFSAPSADRRIVKDKWGIFLSGYAPIKDDKGEPVAILGIDMSARDVYDMQKEVQKRALLVLLLGIILSLFLGTFISLRVTKPVKELIQGTRRISEGDLDYRVKTGGSDEMSELADSFNKMTVKLSDARNELFNYFYRVAQTLVRVLEAKDQYTKGHSDRVADYSEKLAIEMGLPEKRIELLKEAALLHDIGKMGVETTILRKDSSLTPEEGDIIHKHPAIGEDILKPVSLDKDILAVIRGHHERYDGKGYPDRLKGDDINIMAAIVSVADSYDAMTSHRPYMKNMTKEEAVEQLKQNSGTQFNPKVVDAFIEVLKREK